MAEIPYRASVVETEEVAVPIVATIKRISWPAIFAGAVTAVGLQGLFTVLGLAIGLTKWLPQGTDGQNVAIAAGIWWVLTGTLALFLGGLVAGRVLRGAPAGQLFLNGLVLWALTAIFGYAVVGGGSGLMMASDPYSLGPVPRGFGAPGPEASRENALGAQNANGAKQNVGAAQNASTTDTGGNENRDLETERRLARNAAWWALISLVLGIGGSIVGTEAGAGSSTRYRTARTTR
jgi:hypothetical protein